MKQLIATLVILALIAGGALALMRHYQETTVARAYESSLQDLQRRFSERLSPIRSIKDERKYNSEMQALLSWYFGEVQGLRNRFPGHGDPDRVIDEMRSRHEAGEMTKEKLEEYKEHIRYVRWVFERLESGDYSAELTGYSSNLRFDVHDVERDMLDDESRIRLDFVLWGAPRDIEERRDRTGATIRRVVVPVRFARIFFQFLNERGHVHGEMRGASGEPHMKVINPERWVPEFPPMAVLGRYWIDLFPEEAREFIWELNLQTLTASGSRMRSDYRWRLAVPPSWRTDGEWGDGTTTRSRRYIEHAAD